MCNIRQDELTELRKILNIDDTISLKEVVEKMKKEIDSPGSNC